MGALAAQCCNHWNGLMYFCLHIIFIDKVQFALQIYSDGFCLICCFKIMFC